MSKLLGGPRADLDPSSGLGAGYAVPVCEFGVWRQLTGTHRRAALGLVPGGRRFLYRRWDAGFARSVTPRAQPGRLAKLGIASVRTPIRAPRANAIGERLVRTLRSEALDHIIVLNERHLLAVLAEFVTYCNHDRPHRSLGLQSPLPRSPTALGTVVRQPVLGGLHHVDARAA